MALTDAEKLTISTAILRGEPVAKGDVILSMRNGAFIVHDTSRPDPIIYTHSWDEALFNFEMLTEGGYPALHEYHEYTVRVVMTEMTVIAKSPERAEEIAMEIFEGDAHTRLHHGCYVECCEVEDQGPSDEDEETEV